MFLNTINAHIKPWESNKILWWMVDIARVDDLSNPNIPSAKMYAYWYGPINTLAEGIIVENVFVRYDLWENFKRIAVFSVCRNYSFSKSKIFFGH